MDMYTIPSRHTVNGNRKQVSITNPFGNDRSFGKPNQYLGRIVFACLILLSYASINAVYANASVIEEGKTVTIQYTLMLDDGTVLVSNVGKDPLVYQQGSNQILTSLENELTGLQVNDTKKVALSPEQAFGPVDPQAFLKVKPEEVPEDSRKAGVQLVAQDTSGNQHLVRVHEVHDEHIVLNLNHPLAGKHIVFDVHILDIAE